MPVISLSEWPRLGQCSWGWTEGSIAVLLSGGGRADLDDQVAFLERSSFRFPKAVSEPAAVHPETPAAARQVVERAADLLGLHWSLDQLHAAIDGSEIGQVIGDVRALRAAGEEQAGEAHRIDHVVGTRLPRQQLVVGGAD